MKTPLLWSCLALLGLLVVWLLWSGLDDPGAGDLTWGPEGPGVVNSGPHPASQERDGDPGGDQDQDAPSGEDAAGQDARERVQTGAPRSMRIRVLRKADRAPVAGAAVTARDTRRARRLRERAGSDLDDEARAAIRAAASTQATTDAQGSVVLPREGRHWIEAAHGELWGRLFVHEESKEPFEVLLEKDCDLRVRVRSRTTAQPVPGVLVGLRRFRLYGGAFDAGYQRTQSPDGIATFQHVQQILKQEGRWQVFLGVPLRTPGFAPVSLAELPAGPLELVLEDTGSVVVELHDETGAVVDGSRLRCKLLAYPTPARAKPMAIGSYWSSRPIDEQGTVRLSPIGVGLFLRIEVSAKDPGSPHRPVSMDVQGPARAGETVACKVLWRSARDPQAHYPVVTGRLVHNDGSPWPRGKIRVQSRIFPRVGSRSRSRELQLSPAGRFRLVLEEACPAGGKRIYSFRSFRSDRRSGRRSGFGALEARLDLSRDFPPGETDIGDVVLDRGELLVSGQVVDAEGRPLPEARLHVTRLVLTGGEEFWPRVDCVGGSPVAEDGRFALHAIPGMELPAGRLRLEASSPGLLPAEPIGFAIGTRGLRVVLQPGGGLAGSIRLLGGQLASDVTVLVRSGARNQHVKLVNLRKDGCFHRDGLPPGPVTVVAFLASGGSSARAEIADVLIRAGETNQDPRLQGIVLGGDAPAAHVEVFGEDGEPVSRALVRRLDGKGGGTLYGDHRGHCTLHADGFPVQAAVSGFGYAEKRVSLEAGRNRVVLPRALRVQLHTTARIIGKDPAYHLGFMIYHVDPELGIGIRHVYGHTFPYDKRYFDAKGRASVPVPGPGSYEVRPFLFIHGKDNVGRGGVVPMKPFPRVQVVAGRPTQRLQVHIPAGVLADAVRRFAR